GHPFYRIDLILGSGVHGTIVVPERRRAQETRLGAGHVEFDCCILSGSLPQERQFQRAADRRSRHRALSEVYPPGGAPEANDSMRLPATRRHPSTSTKKINLNGRLIVTGGIIIMPMAMSSDETTRSIIRNGTNSTKPISNALLSSD